MPPNNGMKMDGLYLSVLMVLFVTIEVTVKVSGIALARHLCPGRTGDQMDES
jgi:hypothetical protein